MTDAREPFLEELSKPKPNPGGGAAAAYAASLGTALLEKILRLELRRLPDGSSEAIGWREMLDRAISLSQGLQRLREEDVRAYARLATALRTPERESDLLRAFDEATRCPLEIMRKAAEGMEVLSDAGKACKRHLVADLQVACRLLLAAATGAYDIALANLRLPWHSPNRDLFMREASRLLDEACECFERVHGELALRIEAHS